MESGSSTFSWPGPKVPRRRQTVYGWRGHLVRTSRVVSRVCLLSRAGGNVVSTRSAWSPTSGDRLVEEEQVWRWAIAVSEASTVSEVALALAQHGAAAAGASGADLAVMDTDTDRMRFVHSAVLDARIAARWADVDTGDHIPARES